MINQPPRIVSESMSHRFRSHRRQSRGGSMTVSRDAAGTIFAGRKIFPALCLAGLLATLAACAAGTSTGSLATPTAATAAPAAAPAAAPKPAPKQLTATEINEQCWMSTEANKAGDLDKKAKLVDKCVAEKTKAQQGM
jgi:hypothetical protein